MYSGALLKSGSLRDFTALGGVGHPVYAAADQIRTTVARQIGREAADLFAVPKVDAETRHVDWYSPINGDIVPWAAASPEEREAAQKQLGDLNSKIEGHARQVIADPKSNDHQVFGRLLALSTHIPDTSHIFIVKGQPVLSFWGFVPAGADATHHVIAGLMREAAAAPKPSAPPTPPPSPGFSAASGGAAVATMAGSRGPWMRWLWLLPLLLLLLVLLSALRSCGYIHLPVPYVGNNGVVVPGWNDQGNDVATYPVGNTDVAVPSGTLSGTDHSAMTVPDDQVPVTNDQVVPDATTNEQQTEVPPAANDTNTAATDQTNPPQPDQEPTKGQTPPLDTSNDQQQDTSNDEASKPATNKDINSTAPIEPIEIPSTNTTKNGPADFMQGKWRSQTSLHAHDSPEPIRVGYQFNKQGQGTTTLYLHNGVSCSGPSTASIQKGVLKIQDQANLKCTNGGQFQGSTVECTHQANGKTRCVGHYPSGQTYDIVLGQ